MGHLPSPILPYNRKADLPSLALHVECAVGRDGKLSIRRLVE